MKHNNPPMVESKEQFAKGLSLEMLRQRLLEIADDPSRLAKMHSQLNQLVDYPSSTDFKLDVCSRLIALLDDRQPY